MRMIIEKQIKHYIKKLMKSQNIVIFFMIVIEIF